MKPIRKIWGTLARVIKCKSGVAMIEFAVLLPLLILLFAASVEISRLYISYRAVVHATEGLSRHFASLPEYDARAREQAKPVAQALLPGRSTKNFNMQVTVLDRNGAGLDQVFTDTMFGTDPKVDWSNVIKPANYEQGERIIFVVGTYQYKPMFGVLPLGTITLSKTYVAIPFFSRKYVRNEGVAEDKYVY